MTNTLSCPWCADAITLPEAYAERTISCPECRGLVPLDFDPGPAPQIEQKPESEAKTPEFMKANRDLVGTLCAVCAIGFRLGELVHNCPRCGSTTHRNCRKRSDSCQTAACGYAPPKIVDPLAELLETPANRATPQPLLMPTPFYCRLCREPIRPGADYCPHCKRLQGKTSDPSPLPENRQCVPFILQLYGAFYLLFFGLFALSCTVTFLSYFFTGSFGQSFFWFSVLWFFVFLFLIASLQFGLGVFRGSRTWLSLLHALGVFAAGITIMVSIFSSQDAGGLAAFFFIILGPPVFTSIGYWNDLPQE